MFSSDIVAGATGYDRREADKIVAVCVARRSGASNECFISAMFGAFGRKEMAAVLEEAKRWGMTTIWYERHGKLRSLTVR